MVDLRRALLGEIPEEYLAGYMTTREQATSELGTTGMLLSGDQEEGAVIGRVKPVCSAAGRAQYLPRDHGRVVVQLAYSGEQS